MAVKMLWLRLWSMLMLSIFSSLWSGQGSVLGQRSPHAHTQRHTHRQAHKGMYMHYCTHADSPVFTRFLCFLCRISFINWNKLCKQMINVFVKTQEDMSEASIILLQDTSCSVINFSLKVRAVLISSAFFFFWFMSQEIHTISTSAFNYLYITQSKSDFCKKKKKSTCHFWKAWKWWRTDYNFCKMGRRLQECSFTVRPTSTSTAL